MRSLTIADGDEFKAAATQISHDALRAGEGADHPIGRCCRLFLPGEHFDFKAERFDLLDEFPAIAGIAQTSASTPAVPTAIAVLIMAAPRQEADCTPA